MLKWWKKFYPFVIWLPGWTSILIEIRASHLQSMISQRVNLYCYITLIWAQGLFLPPNTFCPKHLHPRTLSSLTTVCPKAKRHLLPRDLFCPETFAALRPFLPRDLCCPKTFAALDLCCPETFAALRPLLPWDLCCLETFAAPRSLLPWDLCCPKTFAAPRQFLSQDFFPLMMKCY